VGGTWLDNHYPGAGVDTPNHLYSYSFASYDWSMYFCLRDELHGYLEHVADEFGIRSAIRFGTGSSRPPTTNPAGGGPSTCGVATEPPTPSTPMS
jgi:4-hydroxyacetophenone monooxygenase